MLPCTRTDPLRCTTASARTFELRACYGDITPRHHRFWYGCYFLLAVVTFTYILGEIVGIAIEVMRWRRLLHLFDGGLSERLIDRMDYTHDGQVRGLMRGLLLTCAYDAATPAQSLWCHTHTKFVASWVARVPRPAAAACIAYMLAQDGGARGPPAAT